MNNNEQILLGLLRRALFGRSFEFAVDEADWDSILKEASAQTVQLLIYDCLTAKERAAIPMETMGRWRAAALHILQRSEQLTREEAQILQMFQDEEMACSVLKGSSCAKNYPRAELRCAGDIDLLVAQEDIERAESLLQTMGFSATKGKCSWHIAMRRSMTVIELHFEPGGLPDGAIGAELRRYFQTVPPLTVCHEAVTLLLHKLNHIRNGGLGLRQLCDWALFVQKQLDCNVWRELEPLLRRFGLLHFAKVVTRLCVDYLGLDTQDALWCLETDQALSRELLEDILQTGNFGCKEKRYGQRLFTDGGPGGRLASMWRVGTKACREGWPVCMRHSVFLPVAPVVLLVRHCTQRYRGERSALRLYSNFREAKTRQALYQALRPFQQEF